MRRENAVARDKVIALYQGGEHSANEIAKASGLERASVRNYLNRAGLKPFTNSPALEYRVPSRQSQEWHKSDEKMSMFSLSQRKALRAGESIYVDGHYFRIAGYAALVANGLIKVATKRDHITYSCMGG